VTEEQSSGALDAIQQQAGLRGATEATQERQAPRLLHKLLTTHDVANDWRSQHR
jgi:hypothetical protein